MPETQNLTNNSELADQIAKAKARLARLRAVDTYGLDHKLKIDRAAQKLAVLILEARAAR